VVGTLEVVVVVAVDGGVGGGWGGRLFVWE
jgi:hypothetical protein